MSFYVDQLGFSLVSNQGDEFIWVALGSAEILLRPGKPEPGTFDDSHNVVIYTEQLQEVVERLRENGIDLKQDGHCHLFQDLDGHWFQVVDPRDHQG